MTFWEYEKLRHLDTTARMESHRASLLERARSYGLEVDPEMDIWRLVTKVHREDDRRELPALQERAQSLGVRTHWLGIPRGNTSLALACYAAEDLATLKRLYP